MALPMIGRRTELALVTRALVGGPGPRAVMLIGEAGVGKTRLLAEAIHSARDSGVTVLVGQCLPLTDSVPFLPLVEALRTLGTPAVLERCSPRVRAELARLVPDWSPAATRSESGPVEGWQRGLLFAALRDLLAALAVDGPYALVVEDLHWADTTTLDFLSYLTAVDSGATRLVLTCRDEEIDPKRPVGRWFVEIARQAGLERLSLGRLSRFEVGQLIRGLVAEATPSSFVDDVFDRAGGNAFFTEQLVAASIDDHGRPQPGHHPAGRSYTAVDGPRGECHR